MCTPRPSLWIAILSVIALAILLWPLLTTMGAALTTLLKALHP